MAKIKDNIWYVFWTSLKLYFSNIGNLLKYMAFPVLGQILGILLMIFASYFYSINLEKNIAADTLLSNISMVFAVLFIVTLPGILVFTKAFWDYLVSYGAINSMIDNMLKSGKIYDFHAHNEVVTRRSASYCFLWFVLAMMGIIGAFPLFWVIAGIMFIYFILVFQAFTFEPQLSILGCLQKSVRLIKGNFARTLGLGLLVGGLTYLILPEILLWLLNQGEVMKFLAIPFDGWTQQLPIKEINDWFVEMKIPYQINSLMIAKNFVTQIGCYVIIAFTLPLRVICWGLWYKALNKGESKVDKKLLERAMQEDSV